MSRRGRLRGWSISGAGHRGKMLSTWRKGAHWLTMAITSARGGPRPTSWTAELGRRRRSRFSTADSAPWAPLPASAQRLRLPLTPLPVPGAPGFGPASPLRFPLAISVPLSAPRQLFSALPRPAPSLYLWLLSPHLSPLCPSARAPLPRLLSPLLRLHSPRQHARAATGGGCGAGSDVPFLLPSPAPGDPVRDGLGRRAAGVAPRVGADRLSALQPPGAAMLRLQYRDPQAGRRGFPGELILLQPAPYRPEHAFHPAGNPEEPATPRGLHLQSCGFPGNFPDFQHDAEHGSTQHR